MTEYQIIFSIKLGFILGIVFCVIYILLSYFFRKIALKNVKNNLESDEFIVCEGKMNFWEIIIPFIPGACLGQFIIPFIIFPEIQEIGLIHRENFYIVIFAELVCLWLAFVVLSWKCVFTNKRMINGFTFEFINKTKFFGDKFLMYSNIERIKEDYYLWFKAIYLILKDNKKYFRIPGFTNKKEISSVITKYIGE